jgi:hypothetical protein
MQPQSETISDWIESARNQSLNIDVDYVREQFKAMNANILKISTSFPESECCLPKDTDAGPDLKQLLNRLDQRYTGSDLAGIGLRSTVLCLVATAITAWILESDHGYLFEGFDTPEEGTLQYLGAMVHMEIQCEYGFPKWSMGFPLMKMSSWRRP